MAQKIPFQQLALQVDRCVLDAELADHVRLDIPAHEHLDYSVLFPSPARSWDGLKRFGISAAVIYCGLFSLTNAAAYGKIALSNIDETMQSFETASIQHLESLTVDPFTSIDSPLAIVPNTETVVTKTTDTLAALLPTPASSNDRIEIPSLKINAPIVEPTLGLEALKASDFNTLEEQIHETLLQGVVHYPGTAEPGEKGNAFLTGHSSNIFWETSDYNTVFALLPKIQVGTDFYVTHNTNKYHYRVTEKKEVKPSDVSVLKQGEDYKLTLVTCTPVGTTFRRLVVTAELVRD